MRSHSTHRQQRLPRRQPAPARARRRASPGRMEGGGGGVPSPKVAALPPTSGLTPHIPPLPKPGAHNFPIPGPPGRVRGRAAPGAAVRSAPPLLPGPSPAGGGSEDGGWRGRGVRRLPRRQRGGEGGEGDGETRHGALRSPPPRGRWVPGVNPLLTVGSWGRRGG